MKKILLGILLAGVFGFTGTAFAQGSIFKSDSPGTFGTVDTPDTEEEPDLTTIEFEETEFDFGEIKQGDKVRHTFTFKNTGEFDAIIENVKPSCGCTKLEAPEAPIPPGGTGEIEIEFNSAGKSGEQHKNITIIYNGNPRFERVFFKGNIVMPTPGAAPEE